MLLPACNPTHGTTTSPPTSETTIITTSETPTITTPAEEPVYGGTLNFCVDSEQTSFDSYYAYAQPFCRMIYDPLLTGHSTTEDQWPFYGNYIPKQYIVGCLADSWEEVAIDTVIFHLKHGVHFQIFRQ